MHLAAVQGPTGYCCVLPFDFHVLFDDNRRVATRVNPGARRSSVLTKNNFALAAEHSGDAMKVGLTLHPDRGVDAVLQEAKDAESQGYDSVWIGDHLTDTSGKASPDGPLDSVILMTAIGAITTRIRLAWAVLNPTFRRPLVTAKMLASLDHITKGRVICSVGAGSASKEHAAYDMPWIEKHDERLAYAREVVRLWKHVWTHPAPEVIDFDGTFIHAKGLTFNPQPYQRPHPPIWIGGESDATLETVRELADGWVLLSGGGFERIAQVTQAPDWPKRPMEVIKNARIHVAATRNDAVADAKATFDRGGRYFPATFDEFLAAAMVGTPEDCLSSLEKLRSYGITYLRAEFRDAAHQAQVAKLLLPLMA
jgi:alkanesulfonate monooxygenase SsuD/methylene tetrahydromethanopterin reductase-like flavin-dependent oxidoreductase (luciferase family)